MKLFRDDFTEIPKSHQALIEELAEQFRVVLRGQENRIGGIALCAVLAEVIAEGSYTDETLTLLIHAANLSIAGRAQRLFLERKQQ